MLTPANDNPIDGPALRHVISFFTQVETSQTLGNLHRITDAHGRARWVCSHHRKAMHSADRPSELLHQLDVVGGLYEQAKSWVAFEEKSGPTFVRELCDLLRKGLVVDRLTVRECGMSLADFEGRLLPAIKNSFIRTTNFVDITVTRACTNLDHASILKRLKHVFGDNSGSCINYIVSRSLLSPDMPRLIHQMMIDYNGSIIVFLKIKRTSYLHVVPRAYCPWQAVPTATSSDPASHDGRELRSFGMSFNDAMVNAVAKGLQNLYLKHISFKRTDLNTNVAPSSLLALMNAISTSVCIESLMFYTCQIGSEGVLAILHGLLKSTKLKHFAITHLKLYNNAVDVLCKVIRENKHLTDLVLQGMKLSHDHAHVIAEACAMNKTLQKLDLSYNNIGIIGLTSVCKALQRHRSLRELDLSNEKFSHSEICQIAKLIENSERLDTLYLSGVSETDDTFELLVDAIQVNNTLQRFFLSANGWSLEAQSRFRDFPNIILQ